MALFTQTFTRAGLTPDLSALGNAIRPTIGDPFYLSAQTSGGDVSVMVEKPAAWTAPHITAVQSAVAAAANSTPRTDAQNYIDAMPMAEKAIFLTINDELNALRTAAGVPTKTPAQMAALVRTKAGTL